MRDPAIVAGAAGLYRDFKILEKVSQKLFSSHQDAIESLEKRIINIELLLTQEDNK